MDHAVALVEAYLRVNGYFTVSEYPIVESIRQGGYRTATDLDVLAFRFPGAGRLILRAGTEPDQRRKAEIFAPDAELGSVGEEADMLIGEVKEGRAELNQGATDPAVLQAVLTRFGCCRPDRVRDVVRSLLQKGHTRTHCAHRVRLVAFGSILGTAGGRKYKLISLGHVQKFLQEYIHQHWDVLRHVQFKDPVFGFLVVLEKARRGLSDTPEPPADSRAG